MINETELIGYAVTVVITLGAFLGVIQKFTQPINDLKVVIQKLNDMIEQMEKENKAINSKLERHGERIDKLDRQLGELATEVHMYHKNKD